MSRQCPLHFNNVSYSQAFVHVGALVHMNPHLFTFGITEGVKFPFDLHQLSLHEWKCRLWEIRGAGSLATDGLVLGIRRNLHIAPLLQRGSLEPVPLLNILTLKCLLPFLLFLRSLRTQPWLASF